MGISHSFHSSVSLHRAASETALFLFIYLLALATISNEIEGDFMPKKGRLQNLPKDELKAIATKGAEASAKAKRLKRTFRESLDILLSMAISSGDIADINDVGDFGQTEKQNITVADRIMLEQIKKALNGDTSAAAFLRDTKGEHPTHRVEGALQVDNTIRVTIDDD